MFTSYNREVIIFWTCVESQNFGSGKYVNKLKLKHIRIISKQCSYMCATCSKCNQREMSPNPLSIGFHACSKSQLKFQTAKLPVMAR